MQSLGSSISLLAEVSAKALAVGGVDEAGDFGLDMQDQVEATLPVAKAELK